MSTPGNIGRCLELVNKLSHRKKMNFKFSGNSLITLPRLMSNHYCWCNSDEFLGTGIKWTSVQYLYTNFYGCIDSKPPKCVGFTQTHKHGLSSQNMNTTQRVKWIKTQCNMSCVVVYLRLCLNNDNDEFKVKLFKPAKDQMTFIVSWYVKNYKSVLSSCYDCTTFVV